LTPADLSLPDRYSVKGHVASGGMAAVYAAHDELLGRDVAVKILAEHLNEDDSAKVRFQREARAAAGLSSHPHVVTIYDVGEHEGRSFIVMELLTGGSLAEVARSGREVDRETAVGWLRDAASALDAAHATGIVHRDVKPANLLLDERGNLMIADFGIARIAMEDQMTATGQVLGTAAYLSPEQALGEPASASSDRYALAVVAFELLTGRRPFTAEHFAAQARAHIEDPPPRASEVRPDLPAALDPVLERGLAKNPDARWPSATAFVNAVASALTEPELETTRQMAALAPPTAATRAAPPRREPPQPPPWSPVAAPAPRRGGARRWAPVLAVGALLALGGVAVAALSGGDDGGQTAQRTQSEDSRAERTPTPTPTPTATPEETATPEPEPTATPEPEPTATPEDGGGGGGGDPGALNNEGYAKSQAGDYAGAVPLLAQAVEACGDSAELDPCGYALFNYGVALNRSGRPAEAIPFLERRLENFSYKRGEVETELAAARQAAGQGGAAPGGGNGNGRGNGKAKGKDKG